MRFSICFYLDENGRFAAAEPDCLPRGVNVIHTAVIERDDAGRVMLDGEIACMEAREAARKLAYRDRYGDYDNDALVRWPWLKEST